MRYRLFANARTVIVAVVVSVVSVSGVAFAAATITSADITNGTIRGRDVHNGTLKSRDIRNDTVRSKDIRDGTVRMKDLSDDTRSRIDQPEVAPAPGQPGPRGPAGEDATYVGPNWSIVDRNVIGNGDSYLRAGPDGAPGGDGSLGVRTGSPDDKTAFGNQVDFVGDPVSGLDAVGFAVFTTGENNSKGGTGADNMPSILFEIDPNHSHDPGRNFTSLVYMPAEGAANEWTTYDATTEGRWGLTSGFQGTQCHIDGARCTFEEVQAYLADGGEEATILTAQITKGRDFAFSGAVDELLINETVYDFEPFGVYERAAE